MISTEAMEIASGPPDMRVDPFRAPTPPKVGEELTRLQVLYDCGALSTDEFIRAKGMVLECQPAGCSARDAYLDVRRRPNWLRRLERSSRDRVFGGVCGGLGEHTPLPSWCWRLLLCAGMFFYGVGAGLYLVLWLFVPDSAKDAERDLTEPENLSQ